MNKLLCEFIQCPHCEIEFNLSKTGLHCPRCSTTWPVKEGIPDFRGQRHYEYDFEYDSDGMHKLVTTAKEHGWLEALKTTKNKYGFLPSEYFVQYNSSSDRAPWVDLLLLGKESTVLDFGCGTGSISASLAQKCGQVISFDASYSRVMFWNVRRAQEKYDNVKIFLWDGRDPCPLKEESFDAIILNGVLEWTPESIQDGNPRDVQVATLKRCFHLLKPGGKLYIGIENRSAAQYIIGARDHHSGLKFVTVLPRVVANLYSRLRKHKPYRVYTHTLRAYRKMLYEGGFLRADFYEAYPRYMFPKKMIPVDDEPMLREVRKSDLGLEHKIIRFCSYFGLAKYLVFTYGIVGHKAR